MLSLLLIVLLGADPVPLDEIYVSKLGRSAQSGSRVMFSVMNRVKPELYLFDFETGMAHLIEDGRMRVFLPHVLAGEHGFTLVTAVGQTLAFKLDREGRFLERVDLSPCLALEPGQRIYAITEDKTHWLATVNDAESSRLIRVDVAACSAEMLYSRRTHGDRGAWFVLGDEYYFVTTDTGEIRVLDRGSSRTEVIRPGIEAVKRPEGVPGRMSHLASLTEPNRVGDRVAFRFLKTRDAHGALLEERIDTALIMTTNGFEETTDYLMGKHGDQWLVFSVEDQELRTKKMDQP